MAWISVKEQGHLATSEDTLVEKTATRVFIAISDTPTTTVAAESADDGTNAIPAKNAAHPDDSTRKVKSRGAKPDPESGRTVFIVEVNYSNVGRDIPENPLERPDEVSWDFNDSTEAYFVDRSDTPKTVVNSAGERFLEFLERDTGAIRATVVRNLPATGTGSYSPLAAVIYKDAVNDDSFDIEGITIPAGQCKMKSYTAGPKTEENGIAFRQATFVLEFRESWDHVVEDRGFNEKDGSTGKLKEIVKGKPATKVDTPWPLDGSGVAKANAADVPATTDFKPYYRETFSTFAPFAPIA